MRYQLGLNLIRLGFFLLPAGVKARVIRILLYHVPGALDDVEKAQIRQEVADEMERRRALNA